jgi:hypothetical protein
MGAPAASASGISLGAYPATVNGQGVGGGLSFNFGGGLTAACGGATYDSGSVSGPTETLPTTVSLTECTSGAEGKVTVKMNGCKFIYHPAVGAGTFDIGPAGCGPVTMEGSSCTRTLSPQNGLSATFSNEGSPSKVRIEHNATGVQYAVTKGSKALCGSGGNSTFTGTGALKAFNEGGTQVDAKAIPGTGFYLTGKESGEPANQPKFEAESYPVTLTGVQDPASKQVLTIGANRKVSCQAVDTGSTASGATSQLTLNVAYSGCTLEVLESQFPATYKMNGCSLTLNALNVGPPYSGSLGIACAKEGEAIEIDTTSAGTPLCTYKISPQAGLTGVGLSNVGTGTERGVTATYGVSGLTVTRAKGTLAACGGASQSATYAGATTLHGLS